MASPDKYGEWALVAGAAEGIGKAFSEELAAKGFHLLLVDVDRDKTERLIAFLKTSYAIQAESLILDLVDDDAASRMIELMQQKDCRLVVYNAAYGPVKSFGENSTEEIDRYINVNNRTLIHFIHRLIPFWKGKKAGFIIMSSLAGLFGTQLVAPYSATKAFDVNLGEALHHELKPLGIDVLVCCAGATDTPNFRNTQPDLNIFPKPYVAKPAIVAREAINNLGKKALHIAGFQNRLNYFILSKLMPRNAAVKIFSSTMKRLYSKSYR